MHERIKGETLISADHDRVGAKHGLWTLDSGLDSWTGLWTEIWTNFWMMMTTISKHEF